MEKKKLAFVLAMAATIAICAAVAGCLSCEGRPLAPIATPTEEERLRMEKSSWEALMTTHLWEPQVNNLSTGVSPFDCEPAVLSISKEDGKLVAMFIVDGHYVGQGTIVFDGRSGTLSAGSVEHRMTFSKNPDGSKPVIAIYYNDGQAGRDGRTPVCYDMAPRPAGQ